MSDHAPVTIRFVAVGAMMMLALPGLAACSGGESGGSGSGPGTSVTPPPPPPPPPPTSQYRATEVPFGLAMSRSLDVFGWDQWPADPVPSAAQLRWNATSTQYEILTAGLTDFGQLRALANSQTNYQVFNASGAMQPLTVDLLAPTASFTTFHYIGELRVFEGSQVRSYVTFGLATTPGDIPSAGIKTCTFGEDEIGDGELTIDFTSGIVTGSVAPFYPPAGSPDTRYPLTQANLSTSGTTAISTTYGTGAGNLLEARFFGPQAAEIGVRIKGSVSGIMTGICKT